MNLKTSCASPRNFVAVLCVLSLMHGEAIALIPSTSMAQAPAQTPPATPAPAAVETAPKIPNDQLDSLVAPIALYPDPLLAQVLAASTYPLEIVQLQQWLVKNDKLKDKKLADAVAKQPWDPSIQGLSPMPDVVKRLSDDIQWTTDLGNAFLTQKSDVMDAVQRMRKKAQDKGNLKSTEQQKVETQVIENKSVIIVEQSNPQVVYVPSYDPVVVYGAPIYPYPPIYYPPYYGVGLAVSFGVGLAIGAAWGGGWGYGCGWGGNDININMNNNFNKNNNFNRNNVNGGNRNFQHNPTHRGGAPYSDRSTANKFGGTARGDSLSNRQSSARDQVSRSGGNLPSSTRPGASDRAVGGADRAGAGAGASNRATGGAADRAGAGAGAGNRATTGSNSIGNRSTSGSTGSSNRSALGGGSSSSAGASSRQGSSSMGSSSRSSSGGGAARSSGGGGGRAGGGGGRRR